MCSGRGCTAGGALGRANEAVRAEERTAMPRLFPRCSELAVPSLRPPCRPHQQRLGCRPGLPALARSWAHPLLLPRSCPACCSPLGRGEARQAVQAGDAGQAGGGVPRLAGQGAVPGQHLPAQVRCERAPSRPRRGPLPAQAASTAVPGVRRGRGLGEIIFGGNLLVKLCAFGKKFRKPWLEPFLDSFGSPGRISQ